MKIKMGLLKNVLPLVGIALLLYVINKIGFLEILNSFSEANWTFVVFALLIYIPMILLQTAKWDFILKKQKFRFNFNYLLKLQFISSFYEMITPARIGSFIKIMYLQDKIKNLGKAASSVVIDRFIDFLSVAFLAFMGSILLISNSINTLYMSVIVFITFLLGFIVLTNKRISKIFWNIAYKLLIPKRLKKKALKSFNDFYKVLPNIGNIIILFLLTFVFWLIVYTQAYIFALAFNVKIPYIQFILIFPISVIISLIPITVSGLGMREASLLAILSKFGMPSNGIVTFSLVWSGTAIIIYSIPFLYLLIRKKI